MVSGLELATLSFVHSWEYVFFDAVVELFFSSLLASSPRLVSFDLLVAACRFFPSNRQLVDELAVLVDPRSVYGLASPEPAHQAALQAAFFVLRSSWMRQTVALPSAPRRRRQRNAGSDEAEEKAAEELELRLADCGLDMYISVLRKCKVRTSLCFCLVFLIGFFRSDL